MGYFLGTRIFEIYLNSRDKRRRRGSERIDEFSGSDEYDDAEEVQDGVEEGNIVSGDGPTREEGVEIEDQDHEEGINDPGAFEDAQEGDHNYNAE